LYHTNLLLEVLWCRKISIAASTGASGRRNCWEWSVYFSGGVGGDVGGDVGGGGDALLSLPLVLLQVLLGVRKEKQQGVHIYGVRCYR